MSIVPPEILMEILNLLFRIRVTVEQFTDVGCTILHLITETTVQRVALMNLYRTGRVN